MFPAGSTINLIGKPDRGNYGFLNYSLTFGTDMVPNVFAVTGQQYGSNMYNGVLTKRWLQSEHTFFVFVTDQQPSIASVTNLSPIAQRYEAEGEFLVIPNPEAMELVMDALRRINTSTRSETLLQEAVAALGDISGNPVEPRPSVAGGQR